jgi:hypothetical protein
MRRSASITERGTLLRRMQTLRVCNSPQNKIYDGELDLCGFADWAFLRRLKGDHVRIELSRDSMDGRWWHGQELAPYRRLLVFSEVPRLDERTAFTTMIRTM